MRDPTTPPLEYLRLMLAHAPVGVVSVDREGTITLFEGAALARLGRAPGDMVGRPVRELNEAPWLADDVARALGGERFFHVAEVGDAWLGIDGLPVRDETGEVVAALLFASDLTREKRLESELRQAEHRYRRLRDVAFEGIAIHDGGLLVDVNPSFLQLFGYDAAEEVIGKNVLELAAPESRAIVAANIAAGVEEPYGAIGLRKDGGTFIGELRSYAVAWGDRALRVTAIRELEQQRRLERGYQALAGQLSAVLEHMVEAVVVVDTHGNFTQANHAARKLFGIETVEEMTRVRNGGVEVRRPDGTPIEPGEHVLARALRGEVVENSEEAVRVRGQQRSLRLSAAPIRDPDGRITGAVCVIVDLTAEIAFDHLKDQFLSVAAHELRTPVAVIKSSTQVALEDSHSDEGLKRTLDRIDRGASRIDRIVADLLDASQLQLGRLSLHPAPLDLGALVAEAARDVAESAPQHSLELRCAPVTVDGDGRRLRQVVTQLLRNAIKYSPRGGAVEVSVARDGAEAVVAVHDHGVGIARDRQASVFESFYSAHSGTAHDYGGLGVGLHVAREFVRRHGGRMWFESEEDVGSTFCFALPARPT